MRTRKGTKIDDIKSPEVELDLEEVLKSARKKKSSPSEKAESPSKMKSSPKKAESPSKMKSSPIKAELKKENQDFVIDTEPTMEVDEERNDIFCVDTSPSKTVEDDEKFESGVESDENEEEKITEEPKLILKSPKKKERSSSSAHKKDGNKNLSKMSEEAEKHLQQFLFGFKSEDTQKPKVEKDSESDLSEKEEEKDSSDSEATDSSSESEDEAGEKMDTEETSVLPEDKSGKVLWGSQFESKKRKRPAWTDQDDKNVLVKDVTATYTKARGKHGRDETSTEAYSKAVKRKYLSIFGTPKWADLNRVKDEDLDSDDEFFRETTEMLQKGKTESLEKGTLEYRKLKDVNSQSYREGTVIKATEFHPTAAVCLVAGLNGTASLFQVDGKTNPKMQTVNFQNFPVKTARFSAIDGREFYVGSQHHGFMYSYDMEAGVTSRIKINADVEKGAPQNFEVSPNGDYIAIKGRFGNVFFLSAKSKERLFSVKANADITSMDFSADGKQLYTHSGEGEVYIWDVRQTRECSARFVDDGCVRGAAVAVSPDNRFVAAGSDAGVVNVYRRQDLFNSTVPKPEKILLNLTTRISGLKFNPSSEILAFYSEHKENALKLCHLQSMTVFSNFPKLNLGQNSKSVNLKRVNSANFSTNGGFLAVGNNGGAASLFRLKHFGSM